jgi:hypothetical protein
MLYPSRLPTLKHFLSAIPNTHQSIVYFYFTVNLTGIEYRQLGWTVSDLEKMSKDIIMEYHDKLVKIVSVSVEIRTRYTPKYYRCSELSWAVSCLSYWFPVSRHRVITDFEVLRRIFDSKRQKLTGRRKNCMRSFIICDLHQIRRVWLNKGVWDGGHSAGMCYKCMCNF